MGQLLALEGGGSVATAGGAVGIPGLGGFAGLVATTAMMSGEGDDGDQTGSSSSGAGTSEGGSGLPRAVRDDAYTTSRHTAGGKQVVRDVAKGKEAHVFNADIDLTELEAKVWAEGTSQGRVRGFERFSYTSETPIGTRIQAGKPDVPLHTVEIKGKLEPGNVWQYHLVPRTRPAR